MGIYARDQQSKIQQFIIFRISVDFFTQIKGPKPEKQIKKNLISFVFYQP